MRLASITTRAMSCRAECDTEVIDSNKRRLTAGFLRGVGMSRAEVEVTRVQDTFSTLSLMAADAFQHSPASPNDRVVPAIANRQGQSGPRRTPRKSLIVVLPENHVVSPDLVAVRLPAQGDDEEMDVILACAGQSTSIAALQRQVRDLRVLRAPAGTSTEDLREFAMRQAPGDIVTLLCGTPA
jgi:hypothetical protein